MTEDEQITEILRREGWDKYTDRPSDRGGPTKWGITLKRWSEYIRAPATPAMIQAITEKEARAFYRTEYIDGPGFGKIKDVLLREIVVDIGVNSGTGTAAKWIQACAGVTVDGVIGPVSIAAINSQSPVALAVRISAARVRLYGRLTSTDPELKKLKASAKAAGLEGWDKLQAENTGGWCNRAAEFLEQISRRIDSDLKRNSP